VLGERLESRDFVFAFFSAFPLFSITSSEQPAFLTSFPRTTPESSAPLAIIGEGLPSPGWWPRQQKGTASRPLQAKGFIAPCVDGP